MHDELNGRLDPIIKMCYDGGTCRNESFIEDLIAALGITVTALRQYASGKTWRHIAIEALEELAQRGLVEKGLDK